MAGLIKETWLNTLQMAWQEKPTWLKEGTDLAPFLAGDGTVINLAHAGADPAVFVNNNVWPLSVQTLTETPGSVSLDYFLTDPTVVIDAEKKAFSYDKQKGDVQRHLNAIMKEQHLRGSYNAAPVQHLPSLPCIATTGAVQTGGRLALRFADLITLAEAFDAAGIDPDGRNLVLSAAHFADLQRENLTMFNQLVTTGRVNDNFGWKIHRGAVNPCFEAATGEKASLGAAENPGTGVWRCSFAFQHDSFGYVRGAAKFFSDVDNPQYAGTIINFGQFFMALPVRNYGLGAIYNAQ